MARKAGKKRSAKSQDSGLSAGDENHGTQISVPVISEEEKRAAMTAVLEASKKDGLNAKAKTNSGLTLGKAIKKAAEITGFDKDAIGWWAKNRDRDPQEIDRETRERNKVAVYMDMPIGGQLGLLEDGSSVASGTAKENNARLDNDEGVLRAAEEVGETSGKDGKNFDSNPFPAGSKRAARWGKGWKAGNASNVPGQSLKAPTHESAHA